MKRIAIALSILITSNLTQSVFGQQASYWQQNVDYEINVTLDDVNNMLTGSMAMRYTNNSPDALPFIWIHLWPNAYKNTETAFAKQKWLQGSAKFQFSSEEDKGYIDNLKFIVDAEPATLEYDPENPDIAKLILNKPVQHGQTINIKTTFRVKIPRTFSRMGHTGQQYQITQWFPKPAVYDQYGWHPIPYLDQGEFYSEYGNFHVYITVPKNYVVAASGDLQTPTEKNWLDSIAIATSQMDFSGEKNLDFPPSAPDTKTLEYRLKDAHDFAWFADKRFHVMKSSVTLPESERVVDTYVYFDDDHAVAWKKACDYVNRSVLFYSDKIGEYVWNVAQAVDGSLEVEGAGGMEYPTVTVISGSYDDQSLDDVITHEVGHNWFYGMLGSNERDHGWMDEGINSYYEERYMDTYYGHHDPLGIPSSVGEKLGFKGKSADDMLYAANNTLAKQNRAQAINLTAADYSAINYGLFIYMQPAYDLRYIAYELGQDEFDRIMHKYFKSNVLKHVYPVDMQRTFEAETGQSYAWFFDKMINSDRGPDYLISRLQKGKTAMAVDVANNSDIAAPFSMSLMHGDSIMHTDWYQGFTGKQTIYVNYKPEWDVTKIKIDPKGYIPETERENNTIKTSGLLKRYEPVQLKWMGAVADDPDHSTIGFTPTVAWNNNDRWMAGLAIWNSTLPTPKIEYVLAPMYSFTPKTLTGQGSIGLNFYPDNGWFDRIRISESGARYTYDDFHLLSNTESVRVLPQYNKLQTKIEADLHRKSFSHKLTQSIAFRNIFIDEEDFLINYQEGDLGFELLPSQYMVNELSYRFSNATTNLPQTVNAALEFGSNYSKLYVTYSTRINYPKSKSGLEVRLFGGGFLYNNMFDARKYFTANGSSGASDYLYDDIFFGRNAETGLCAQQFSMNNGFLKTPVLNAGINTSNTYLLAANFVAPVPKMPVGLFGDFVYNPTIAEADDSKLLYDAGIVLRVPKNIFEIYFPLLMSEPIKEGFSEGTDYAEKITFMIKLNTANLFELRRKLSL